MLQVWGGGEGGGRVFEFHYGKKETGKRRVGKQQGAARNFSKKIDFSSVLVIASFLNGKIDMPGRFQKNLGFMRCENEGAGGWVGGGCRQGRSGKKRKASKAIALRRWWLQAR